MLQFFRRPVFAVITALFAVMAIGGIAFAATYTPPCTTNSDSCRQQRITALESRIASLDTRLAGSPGPTVTATATATVTATPTPTQTSASPTPTVTSASPTPTTTQTVAPGEWPGADNTGVPAGTNLTVVNGSVDITVPGTVYDAKEVHGDIRVLAHDVTIKRTRVFGQIENRFQGSRGGYRTTVVDSEIDGQNQDASQAGVALSNITVRRVEVKGWGSGIRLEDDALVEDSWVHGLYCASGAHATAIGQNGGRNITLRHNNLEAFSNCASAVVSFYGDFYKVENITVEGNLLNGGAYATWTGADEPGKPFQYGSNIVYRNNVFGTKYNPNCGYYGAVAGWRDAPGNVWSGNVFDDGRVVNP